MRTPSFARTLSSQGLQLRRATPTWLQVNVGKHCNQVCRHCHVDAGPTRTERMGAVTADRVLWLLERNPELRLLDLTGGAPELNPHFRRLVTGARALGRDVIDRCNLTVLFEPGQEDTARFLADNDVQVVASLPCYSIANVDNQRGGGVFARSIAALQILNELGYGTRHELTLVYNPGGAFLPPDQLGLERDYKTRMWDDFGVTFSSLSTITNMPIARFASDLSRQGRHEEYMELLVSAFNPATLDGLMCRHLLSVGWDGAVYDCDFNQMLELDVPGGRVSLFDLEDLGAWKGRPIRVDDHCFGCTAGAGSSCGGALA